MPKKYILRIICNDNVINWSSILKIEKNWSERFIDSWQIYGNWKIDIIADRSVD